MYLTFFPFFREALERELQITAEYPLFEAVIFNHFWIMERKLSSGFIRIFTVAFLLFLATAGALTLRSNHKHLPNLRKCGRIIIL